MRCIKIDNCGIGEAIFLTSPQNLPFPTADAAPRLAEARPPVAEVVAPPARHQRRILPPRRPAAADAGDAQQRPAGALRLYAEREPGVEGRLLDECGGGLCLRRREHDEQRLRPAR